MIALTVAVVACGLFAGAAIYVSLVEHPARVRCGTELALREFRPSYSRGAVMQASLAVTGCAAGLLAGWQRSDTTVVIAAALLGLLVPFTLIVILPTNQRLLDPELDVRGREAAQLLRRWGHLHAVRSLVSTTAFLMLAGRLGAGHI